MLKKYFKRQKNRGCASEGCGGAGGDDVVDSTPSKRHSLRSTTSFCDELLEEWSATTASLSSPVVGVEEEAEQSSVADLSICGALSMGGAAVGADEDIFKYRSRLSMSLPAIVNDANCLSFFVQYLDSKHALPLIKFYLDTENFRKASFQQLERRKFESAQGRLKEDTYAVDTGGTEVDDKPITDDEEKEKDEEENSVPELKTLCDLSMRKPLTDDEKSQIYAETNKQLTKCNNNNFSNSKPFKWVTSEDHVYDSSHGGTAEISAASVKDAIAIYKKYLIANAEQFVVLPVAIISQISLLLCKREDDYNCGESVGTAASPISPHCFDEAQQHVLEELHEYLDDYLQSSYYCQYCVELIEGTRSGETLTIYDILYSEVTLFFFMEFLEQHGERSCLDFWTTAINFRKSYTPPKEEQTETATTLPSTQSQLQSDAMIIYEKFFSLQSESRLWLSDKLRSHVEERICAVDGSVAACFDVPLQVVAQYLAQKYLGDFLASQLFENYVNELRAKIHEEHVLSLSSGDTAATAKLSLRRTSSSNNSRPAVCHRKTLSDCGSGGGKEGGIAHRHSHPSISQQNTLLAMADTGSSASHLRQMPISAASLQIDAQPQLLWQRSTSVDGGVGGGGLKFGRVNALGRYERDFDALDGLGVTAGVKTPGNWSFGVSSARLKNAMRKLVNLPEDKVQEEIAWQVAEMIVNDVTSVTLNSSANLQAKR